MAQGGIRACSRSQALIPLGPSQLTGLPLHGNIMYRYVSGRILLELIEMSVEHSVREFMTSPVSSLPSTAPLLDAALLLRSTHIRHIPIVDGEILVGILSDRDVQRCTPSRLSRVSAEEYNSIFQTTQVGSVMTREPQTVSPGTPLHEAVTLLRTGKLGCLPVVEDGKLVGIITKDDMLAALLQLLNGSPVTR